MSTHCPGFENNKSLSEITLKCPECSTTIEVFSDEMEKKQKCPSCNAQIDPQTCKVEN